MAHPRSPAPRDATLEARLALAAEMLEKVVAELNDTVAQIRAELRKEARDDATRRGQQPGGGAAEPR